MQKSLPLSWQLFTDETLSATVIHIWYLNFNKMSEDISAALSLLNAEEVVRANRFVFAHHQRRFILARAGLRVILARYLHQSPKALEFSYGEQGKPSLSAFPECQFNVSHSENIALYAVTLATPLGIDIEFHKPMADQLSIAERFFSQQEYHQLKNLPISNQSAAFFRTWTCKEAFIKAVGQGLSYPLDQFTVNVLPNEPAALLNILPRPQEVSQWEIHDFIPATDYTAALAIPRRQNSLRFFECSADMWCQ